MFVFELLVVENIFFGNEIMLLGGCMYFVVMVWCVEVLLYELWIDMINVV